MRRPPCTSPGDQTRTVNGIFIHAIGSERRQLEERRSGIDQIHDPIAGQQLATADVPFPSLLRAAESRFTAARLQLGHQCMHALAIGTKFDAILIDG